MSKLNLVAHCGAHYVNRQELSKVALPPSTETFIPVGHDYFVDLVEDRLNDRGLKVVDSAFALANDGGNMFGMLQVGAPADSDYALIVGLRNSHIKWFPAALACGSGVFVCDNMAFSGEVVVGHKHTAHILKLLPDIITDAVGQVHHMKDVQDARYEAYKSRKLDRYEADHVMVEMMRREIMNTRQMPKMIQQWDTPDHEEFKQDGSGWRMFNAATETLKGTNVATMPSVTRKLHNLMDEVTEFEYAEAA